MIIIFSSMKGGTGKSTLSFNFSLQALLNKQKIETHDLDSPQFSFTRYYKNRKNNQTLQIWNTHNSYENIKDLNIINDKNSIHIIDSPGKYDKDLLEIHKQADIIITPINDSFIDLNTIMEIDKNKLSQLGAYYELIFESQNYNPNQKWFIVRNRIAPISTNHSKKIQENLHELERKLGCKYIDGLKDRVIFKELFNEGETVLDIKTKLSISNLAAKFEIQSLYKKILTA